MAATQRSKTSALLIFLAGLYGLTFTLGTTHAVEPSVDEFLKKVGLRKGICGVLGSSSKDSGHLVTEIARKSEFLIYFQSGDARELADVRSKAVAAGLLGNRVFADHGGQDRIHLADNLLDALIVGSSSAAVKDAEILRVLHPGAKAILGTREIVKAKTPGMDEWNHPNHGPDNNPQSTDQIARAPYLTQFIADPKFSPMPELSVIGGGRVFKAFGHIAHRANQNEILNTLAGINAYNGTILWKRPLPDGFMIHRNTMIATEDILYLGDDLSCKLINASTGEIEHEIVLAEGVADGTVWKWMGVEDGILYALVGGEETSVKTIRSNRPGMGGWAWDMWEGHDYADPKTNFGFGRTILAIDLKTRRTLWTHREEDYLDSRGVCMKNGRIFFYSPGKFLACLKKDGTMAWKTSDKELLAAIDRDDPAQIYQKGYSTQTYIKCDDERVYFAGPQRNRLVVIDVENGYLLWKNKNGNLQLVLRSDAVYAAASGSQGLRLEYETGKVLGKLPKRRACTKATGSIDSIFYRTPGGTVRIDTASNKAEHIAPMRPPCQDGVMIANGLLYWGPWMCACQLSLYGHICLGPGGDFHGKKSSVESRLVTAKTDTSKIQKFELRPGDWPSYRKDSLRSGVTRVKLPKQAQKKWEFRTPTASEPTAPVAGGGRVFFGDRAGILWALDGENGSVQWQAHTGAAIYGAPAIDENRVFVGSADGRVYAFEATTGRELWRFRVAPAERIIPIYGKLISTWPVAAGILVQDGVVYAAAGIAHYDGTHVVALDARTGKMKWYNDTSGKLSRKVNSGISVQGNLYRRGNELRFLGGGVYQAARYDMETGECLNKPWEELKSRYKTAFYPFYPRYSQYQSLTRTFADGKTLKYFATYHGLMHRDLQLLEPLPPGTKEADPREARRNDLAQGEKGRKVIWKKEGQRYQSLVVTPGTVLAVGESGKNQEGPFFLSAIDLEDGEDIWSIELSAAAVRGGTAIDHDGHIFVALQNGEMSCFAAP